MLQSCIVAATALAAGGADAVESENNRWEKAIRKFEEADARKPPALGGVLFVGSSSIRGWDLDKWFPGLGALNRGFGGSTYADAIFFADRIILTYRPKTIVIYDGDNDIANGMSPEQVFADFKALADKIRHGLPSARIIVLSIKSSIAHWEMWDEMRRTNELIEAFAETDPHIEYVDLATPLLGEDGKPRPELFKKDGLHLNEDGYEIWSSLLRPLLCPGEKRSAL